MQVIMLNYIIVVSLTLIGLFLIITIVRSRSFDVAKIHKYTRSLAIVLPLCFVAEIMLVIVYYIMTGAAECK